MTLDTDKAHIEPDMPARAGRMHKAAVRRGAAAGANVRRLAAENGGGEDAYEQAFDKVLKIERAK